MAFAFSTPEVTVGTFLEAFISKCRIHVHRFLFITEPFPPWWWGFWPCHFVHKRCPLPTFREIGLASIVGPSVFTSEQSGMQSSALLRYPDSEQFPGLKVEEEKCLPWAVSTVRGATVSVMRLEVPSRARSEFEKACGA